MKKIAIIFLGFMMITLFSSFFNLFFGDTCSPGTKRAHKITKEIGKKFKEKYGLQFMGISEEGPDGKYITIGLELDYDKVLTKDEGRVLLLNCACDALEAFNSYPQFRQYMADYPFTGDNIIINIYAHHPQNYDVYHPDITVFSFYNDTLWYKTKSPQNPYKYYSKEKESHKEAIKIVEDQRKGNLPFSKS